MNHYSDNDETTLDLQKAKTPHVIMPQAESNAESLEPRSAEAIEANIDRLAAGTLGVPDSNVSNFDALEFAKLSSGPSSNELSDDSVIRYAEADPYVNPAELNQAPSMNVNETETPGTHLTHPLTPSNNPVDPMS